MEVPTGVPATGTVQGEWATPEKWRSYQGIITELYQTHTLKEVKKIMRDEHKFCATDRMYKCRFNKWGLQKKFKAEQVQALLHQKAERDAAQKASSMYVGGKKVDSKKLQTYINRTSKRNRDRILAAAKGGRLSPSTQRFIAPMVAVRTPSPVQPFKTPSTIPDPGQSSNNETDPEIDKLLDLMLSQLEASPPQTRSSFLLLSASDAQARTEKCMRCLQYYAADNFESGRWSDDLYEKGLTEDELVVNWTNLFVDVYRFLDSGQSKRAFRLLNVCCSQYATVLSTGSVRLFFSISTIIYHLHRYPEVVKSIIKYAYEMSQQKYSVTHPFTALLGEFLTMSIGEMMSSWKPLIDRYSSFIMERLNDGSELMFEVVMARNEDIKNQAVAGLVDFNVAEDLLQKDITRWENYTHALSFETVCLKRDLSYFYFYHRRYDDGNRIILEIADSSEPSSHLETLANVAIIQGNFEQAIDLYTTWFTWCRDRLGLGHRETVNACLGLGALLQQVGDSHNADIIAMHTDVSLNILCEGLDELELQEMHDEEGGDGNNVELASSTSNGLVISGDALGVDYYEGQTLGSLGDGNEFQFSFINGLGVDSDFLGMDCNG
ncbi:hypothetical protein BGZ63DRAFT_365542 [Mariannaea sp. PMI_226]|nr:hypothetical protein BGZ63DRAFT_365542 [Mariannaea sp. PMI_226]